MSSEKIELSEAALAVWASLRDRGPLEVAQLVENTGLDQAQVAAIAAEGEARGFLRVEERQREEIVPSAEALQRVDQGLPERRALGELVRAGGSLAIRDLASWASREALPLNEIVRWGHARGWLQRESDRDGDKGQARVVMTGIGRAALDTEDDDERALQLAEKGSVFLDELPDQGLDPDRVRTLLGKRPQLARLKRRTRRIVALSEAGRFALADRVEVKRERNALTPEDLQSGAWRQITLRPYDVKLAAQEVYPAKIHPLRKILEETRRAFLEMGFTEVVSPMVELAFWNFDALFQPQDHPARDMQDTFYMARPQRAPLPDEGTVERVRRTHEDGWETGSEGWGYRWDPETARRLVLRTHTTAATIRALADHPQPPLKVFCTGWVYRNETIDFKHLPVFHQVDGVIIDEGANLATLLGTLREFYLKMGFERVKFKPAFYPYTEPSADVIVYLPWKGQWMEMGGSGVFRPEVTLPFGCRHRVLAWGLGLERLAMLRYGLKGIRELYDADLSRMQEIALCR